MTEPKKQPVNEPTDEPTLAEPTLAEKLDRSVADYRAKDERFVESMLEPGETVQQFYPAARTGPHFLGLQALWGVPVFLLAAALVVPLSVLAAALIVVASMVAGAGVILRWPTVDVLLTDRRVFVLRASPWRRVLSFSPRDDVRAHWVSDAAVVLDLPAGPISLRPLSWIRAYYEDLPAQFGAPAATSHDDGPTA
jgi:hypothetical protein